MKFTGLRLMLWTEDLQETIDFYVKILDVTCNKFNEDWGWATLSKDAVEIMLAKPNAHTPFEKPQFTGSLYFSVEDVDSSWETLKYKVKIAYDIENFEYGMREFTVYDNNGYLLQFGQELTEDD